MPPSYERTVLEELKKQSEEQTKILRGLRRDSRWGKFWGLVKFTIIVGPLIFAYYYLQPHFGDMRAYYDTYKTLLTDVSKQLKSIEMLRQQLPQTPTGNSAEVQKLLEEAQKKLLAPKQ